MLYVKSRLTFNSQKKNYEIKPLPPQELEILNKRYLYEIRKDGKLNYQYF